MRAAIHAALGDDHSMGAIRRIVGDIAARSRLPEREVRALVVEEYLRGVDRLNENGAFDIELDERLEELRAKFNLSRSECMYSAA
jgi:hypothetical protein